jgi:hypothetical protein
MSANPAPFALAPASTGAYAPRAPSPGPPALVPISPVVAPATFGKYYLRLDGIPNINYPVPSAGLNAPAPAPAPALAAKAK